MPVWALHDSVGRTWCDYSQQYTRLQLNVNIYAGMYNPTGLIAAVVNHTSNFQQCFVTPTRKINHGNPSVYNYSFIIALCAYNCSTITTA